MANQEKSGTPVRAFQWDLARQVERLDVLIRLLPRYASWGYQELYLHLEDAVHYPGLPGIGRDDAYSYEELGELVLAAAQAGIRVVPIANLLGHTQYLIKHPAFRDLNELRDERGRPLQKGQICPLHPRTPDVAATLLRDLAPYCTAGKIHVGLDESFHLGKCPRCREEVARTGLAAHFAGHVQRLHGLCRQLDLQMGMWADMLYFVPDAIPLLPAGLTAYDWYYYPFQKLPRVEMYNFAERDLATPLQAHGIKYYGCPMNGAFRHEPLPVFGDRIANLRSWWRRCTEVKAEGFLVTSWEAYRLALETTTVVDAAAANLWLRPESGDEATTMLADGLKRVFPENSSRPLARELLAADEKAFCGYARWQINDRWDTFASGETLKRYESEWRFFRKLGLRDWPAPFAASFAFRTYIAARDCFVRLAARDVFRLRKLQVRGLSGAADESFAEQLAAMKIRATNFSRELTAGRKAARAMWNRTRLPEVRGQNEMLLDTDAQRLSEWQDWLRLVKTDPRSVLTASPVCGIWQLSFHVHNFAPAVQRVAVEQRKEDGAWIELAGRHTIEFRAQAARPKSRIRREFSVPLAAADAILRISIYGAGQVAISHLQLTDGVAVHRRMNWSERKTLGSAAPQQGLPDLTARTDFLLLDLV
jgi:hypothetical protein